MEKWCTTYNYWKRLPTSLQPCPIRSFPWPILEPSKTKREYARAWDLCYALFSECKQTAKTDGGPKKYLILFLMKLMNTSPKITGISRSRSATTLPFQLIILKVKALPASARLAWNHLFDLAADEAPCISYSRIPGISLSTKPVMKYKFRRITSWLIT